MWRPAAVLDDLAATAAALLSVAPPGSVVGGIAAARLHGFWLPEWVESCRLELYLRQGVAAPERHAGSRRTELRARRRHVRADEVTFIGGLPLTTAARTWVDLAEHLSSAELVAAGDSALRGDASSDELLLMITRAVHRRGVVRARAVQPLLNARSRSRPESHLRYAIVSAGLPEPAVNKPITDLHGGWLAEPDLSYEDHRLAIEYNGADHATTTRMRKDITRGIDLTRRGGWRTVVFGPAEVFKRPDEVPLVVRQLLREQASARRHPG